MEFTNVHRRFLQVFMSEQVMDKATLCERFSKVLQEIGGDDADDVKSVIHDINKRIKNNNLEIRSTICELTQKSYFALICTSQNAISKTMKYYSNTEQEFFKKILEEIITSNEGCVISTHCINLNTSLSKVLSKTETSTLLKKLIRDKWLAEKDGDVYIGVRSRLELEPFIKVVYADYTANCNLCRQLTLNGYHCHSCDAVYHNHCLKKYFESVRTQPRCPSCKTDWDDRFLNEELNPDMSSDLGASTSGGTSSKRMLRKNEGKTISRSSESIEPTLQQPLKKRMRAKPQ